MGKRNKKDGYSAALFVWKSHLMPCPLFPGQSIYACVYILPAHSTKTRIHMKLLCEIDTLLSL